MVSVPIKEVDGQKRNRLWKGNEQNQRCNHKNMHCSRAIDHWFVLKLQQK